MCLCTTEGMIKMESQQREATFFYWFSRAYISLNMGVRVRDNKAVGAEINPGCCEWEKCRKEPNQKCCGSEWWFQLKCSIRSVRGWPSSVLFSGETTANRDVLVPDSLQWTQWGRLSPCMDTCAPAYLCNYPNSQSCGSSTMHKKADRL